MQPDLSRAKKKQKENVSAQCQPPILDDFGSFLGPKIMQIHQKPPPEGVPVASHFLITFLIDFRSKNGSKFDSQIDVCWFQKVEDRLSWKPPDLMTGLHFLMFFRVSTLPKLIKKTSGIVQKLIWILGPILDQFLIDFESQNGSKIVKKSTFWHLRRGSISWPFSGGQKSW